MWASVGWCYAVSEVKAAEEPDKLRLSSDLSHMKTRGGKGVCRGLCATWKELICMAGYRCGLPSYPALCKIGLNITHFIGKHFEFNVCSISWALVRWYIEVEGLQVVMLCTVSIFCFAVWAAEHMANTDAVTCNWNHWIPWVAAFERKFKKHQYKMYLHFYLGTWERIYDV